MSDPKKPTTNTKDLTGLMDYAKAMEDAGQAIPIPEGSVMEEQKLETIDNFESLEDYGKSNPSTEAPATEDPFATTPAHAADSSLMDFSGTPGNQDELAAPEPIPGPAPLEPFDLSPPAELEPAIELPAPAAASTTVESFVDSAPEPTIETLIREPLRPAIKTLSAPKEALDKIKQYSEQITPGKSAVPASFPFSLLITGELAPEERERLLDILNRENMGIRELDLEPQFAARKILIPRISEYAGVLIVSALRSTRARMRLGPSDTIYATADTQDSDDQELDTGEHTSDAYSNDLSHPAESLPITNDARLPNVPHYAVVDIVTASAALKTLAVEAEASAEYQELLEALQREIKYKAHRKGAHAIVNFSVQLTQLHVPTHYRVLVTGSAIKTI